MFLDFIKFIAQLLIAGVVIRLLEAKTKDTSVGKALSFAY